MVKIGVLQKSQVSPKHTLIVVCDLLVGDQDIVSRSYQ